MANKNPVHKFKKGHKFGKGQPKIPAEVKKMRKDNIWEYTRIANEISKMSIAELEKLAKDKAQNIIRAFLASSMLKSYAKGEPSRLEPILDRTLGKVKQVMEHSGSVSEIPQAQINIINTKCDNKKQSEKN